MKKFVLVCAFALLFLNSFSARTTNADDTKTYYAKIQSTNVQLCSSPSENSPLFKLPYSYFVKVSSAVDDYYKVTYKDVEGYIKKDKVKPLGMLKSSGFLVRHKGLEPLTFARVKAFFENVEFSRILAIIIEISIY